jgi:ATP-dependent protease ClpP protease subunit
MKTKFIVSVPRRFIWLDGYMTVDLSRRLRLALKRLECNEKDEPIRFYIKSMGGDFGTAFEMIQTLEDSKCPIVFVPFSWVASSALLLTQAGRSIFALPGTRFNFHQVRTIVSKWKVGFAFTREDHEISLRELATCDALQVLMYMRRVSFKEAWDYLSKEKQLSFAQAMKVGLIDGAYESTIFHHDRQEMERIASQQKRKKGLRALRRNLR